MKIDEIVIDSLSVTTHNGRTFLTLVGESIRHEYELTEEDRKTLITQLRQPTDEIK